MAGKPGRSGRKPKPLESHAKTGTFRADRHGGGAQLAVVPDVAAASESGWLDEPADVVARVLAAGVDWLAETDEIMRAVLREALELHDRAKAAGSVRDQIAAMQNVSQILSTLGFDPTARSRLGLAKVATVSKLEQLRRDAGK